MKENLILLKFKEKIDYFLIFIYKIMLLFDYFKFFILQFMPRTPTLFGICIIWLGSQRNIFRFVRYFYFIVGINITRWDS